MERARISCGRASLPVGARTRVTDDESVESQKEMMKKRLLGGKNDQD
jgi:hypothetical protein